MGEILLKPIKESTEDYEEIEKRIKLVFRKMVYEPLLLELGQSKNVLQNSIDDLFKALQSGRITFNRGTFSGKFNASISKELKSLGATFNKKESSFKIVQARLPREVREAISASESKFKERLAKIDKKISEVLPEHISDKIKVADVFDRTLFKVDKNFESSVKAVTVTPKLTPDMRKKIADEWQNNMDLWIKDFAEKEIVELRAKIQKSVFAGNRYESAVKSIQESYGVTTNKAKFLARQETGLLMAKFKKNRYLDSGLPFYKWKTIAGSKNHPVRPAHKALEGKVFRWDDPPITSAPGEPLSRNNPGEDYNCRCFAIPIVKFNK